jgi:hypothetical protein
MTDDRTSTLRLVVPAAPPGFSVDALAGLPVETLLAIAAAATTKAAEKLLAGPSRDEDRIITVEEASSITGLSPNYIREHKSLPFVRQRVKHGPIQCSLSAVRAWVATQARRGGSR